MIETAPVIAPNAVFDLHSARQVLGLKENTLVREIRLGRLRASRRAGKYMILGSWLVAWIEAGAKVRRATKDQSQFSA